MQRKLPLLFCLIGLLWMPVSSFAQALEISGTVKSDANEPLWGAIVTVKNGKGSATTGENGSFTISADIGNVLVISYVGLNSQEVTVNNENPIDVTLTTKNNLNDVVVIGYGSQKKSVTTGAISSVKASDIENQPITRIEQAMQGRVSGVTIAQGSGQPGSSATVRIRGVSSINVSDPLYVVDGVPVDNGGIDYLNQGDIASIEVLKDAASAAIYGTRAANGVILVTTKQGKSGPLSVSYSGYMGTQSAAHKLKLTNATEYATLRNEASVAAGGGIIFADPASYGEGTDWQSVIFNNSRIQNHQISLAGGTEKLSTYSSFAYLEQKGIVMPEISNYKRYNFRTNSTYKAKTWLTMGQTFGYAYIKSRGIGNVNNEFGGPLSSAINLDPLTPTVETDPDIIASPPYSNHVVFGDANGNPYGISTQVGQEMINPLAYQRAHEGNYGWSHNLVGNGFIEIKPIKGLSIRSTIGGKMAFWGTESFTPIAYFNASTANLRTSFYRESNRGFSWTFENVASYQREFGLHNITALIGTGAYLDNKTTGVNATIYDIPVDNFKDASFGFNVPATNYTAGGYEGNPHKISSVYGRLIYSYNEKYLFTGIIRRDGSSRFGTNNKYGYFPSASVGWVASKESFFPKTNAVSFLKIRGSYGVTGNDQIGDFRYVSTVGAGRNYTIGDNYSIGTSPNAPSNPDLKWEQTSQLDLGFDAYLFDNFSLGFDYFHKKTSGMLRPIVLPLYVGADGDPLGNVADMSNKGFEFELGYHKTVGDLTINVNGNISYVKNQIINLGTKDFEDVADSKFQNSAAVLQRNAVGQSFQSFYGFETNGIFQNQSEIDNYVDGDGNKIQPDAKPGDFKWKDLNNDGKITLDSDRTFIGSSIPTLTYGLTVSLAYKGFDFLIFGQGASGNKIYNGLRRLDIPKANFSTDALGRWTGEGTSNDYPRLTDADDNKNFSNPSNFLLSSGAYFRIKNIQIGYSIPRSLLSNIGFNRVRIYAGVNNLATFTKYTGYDPEIGGSVFGIDRGIYPQARTYMFGLDFGL